MTNQRPPYPWFGNLSLKTKLIGIAVITSAITLVAATLILGAYEQQHFNRAIIHHLSRAARFIGTNSVASIDFDYPEEAQKDLAGFASDEHMMYAAIYLSDGEEFARYFRRDLVEARGDHAANLSATRRASARISRRHRPQVVQTIFRPWVPTAQ